MTKRLVVFVDKNGYRYVSPEYNGDKTERDFWGIGGFSKTWAEIKEIYGKVKTYPDFIKAIVEVASAYSGDPDSVAYRFTTACKLRKNQEMFEADEIFYIYEKNKKNKPIVSDIPIERKAAILDGFVERARELGEDERQEILEMLCLTDDELSIYNFAHSDENVVCLKPEDFNCELLPPCEFASSSVPVFKIKTKFGDMYIQSETSDDNKVRIYDSRQKYMDYIEGETVMDAAKEEGVSVTEMILRFAYKLSCADDVARLVDMVCDYERITTDWREAANIVGEYSKKGLFENEWINKIGRYFVVIPEN